MTTWGSCTLKNFDGQFLFFSGSLKNDVHNPILHIKCHAQLSWSSCTLTHFDCQFFCFSGSLKNDVRTPTSILHIKLKHHLHSGELVTHNIIDLYGRIHRQMPSYCLYTNSAWN